MSSKQWLIVFAATVLAIALLMVGFNYIVDPFDVFGSVFSPWWSYSETLNPRVAKIEYLDKHHEQYDSYIIGCSSTSSFPVEQLNAYFDASFYNAIMYGADLYDVELMSKYMLEHYEVKNLVVSLYIGNAEQYNHETDPATYGLHYKVDGSSPLLFYWRYLTANPQYSSDKLKKMMTDGYLQQPHDVFDVETGAYDKSRRDVEAIGSLDSYLAQPAYAGFKNYPQRTSSIPYLEECMGSLQAIKEACEANGTTLTVVCPPLYYEHIAHYSQKDRAAFCQALAEVTDYWDFTLSSVSFEPRYFYDETHFRNDIGKMAVARMFRDDSFYIPDDFGYFVTVDTVDEMLEKTADIHPLDADAYTAQVPILMYHHLAEEDSTGDTIAAENFASHMEALQKAGYTAVNFSDLKDYVEFGTPLPEKPIIITFDDGYTSNLTIAAPILETYGMKATVFTIGVSIGKDTYKDTGVAMIPHFSLEDAALLQDVITVESHGYNIHEVRGRDPEPIRNGVLQKSGESEEAYIAFLRNDFQTMDQMFTETLGRSVGVIAYPFGYTSALNELIFKEEGAYATVTSSAKTNTIIKGLPQSLRSMGRYPVRGEYTADQVLEMLQTGKTPAK